MPVKPSDAHKWEFRARFRRNAFGWQSQPAIKRIKEAVKEIMTIAKTDPALAAEGAVILIERLSPALQNIDSSSGAIGSAVYNAIEKLVPVIADAPIDMTTRDKLLERLWQAHEKDEVPYIESLSDHWGQLCGSKAKASEWADRFLPSVHSLYGPESQSREFYGGASACLSALLKAERYSELEELLDFKRMQADFYQEYRGKAAIARELGIAAIEVSNKRVPKVAAPPATEADYQKFLRQIEWSGSYLNYFKSACKRFPFIEPAKILSDLIATTPGGESKWFAAAKELKDFDLAIKLAFSGPCDPRTLTRAARDLRDADPKFATNAGLAAIHWLIAGYGLDITAGDISEAYRATMDAAKAAGLRNQALEIITAQVEKKNKQSTVYKVLSAMLGMRQGKG